jgi:hypothetical protein
MYEYSYLCQNELVTAQLIQGCTNTFEVTSSNPGGRDSSIGIGTGYGLDGPGFESRWGLDFSYTSRPALEPTQPPVQCTGYRGFPGDKAAGAWC